MSEFQRAHRRYSLSAVDAMVAGIVCKVINVSSTGILINGWESPPPQGTAGSFTVRAPMEGKVRSLEISGTVVRVQDDGGVALSFDSPDKDWPKLLAFLDERQAGEG